MTQVYVKMRESLRDQWLNLQQFSKEDQDQLYPGAKQEWTVVDDFIPTLTFSMKVNEQGVLTITDDVDAGEDEYGLYPLYEGEKFNMEDFEGGNDMTQGYVKMRESLREQWLNLQEFDHEDLKNLYPEATSEWTKIYEYIPTLTFDMKVDEQGILTITDDVDAGEDEYSLYPLYKGEKFNMEDFE